MTWKQIAVWWWGCDGCGYEVKLEHDEQPTHWTHTQDGRDLCGLCAP